MYPSPCDGDREMAPNTETRQWTTIFLRNTPASFLKTVILYFFLVLLAPFQPSARSRRLSPLHTQKRPLPMKRLQPVERPQWSDQCLHWLAVLGNQHVVLACLSADSAALLLLSADPNRTYACSIYRLETNILFCRPILCMAPVV